MTTVEVIWATAAETDEEIAHEVIEAPLDGWSDEAICNRLFIETNNYGGEIWGLLQPLPENRTHTALSVGDYVVIDRRMYRCATFGWKRTRTFIPGLQFRDPTDEDYM